MTLDEFIASFTEDQWENEENWSPKIIWNTAITSAIEECQKEINALKRSDLMAHAVGALGCKNAIGRLLST